ncbi:MAG: hypothetical protein PH343_02375, partial [Nitrospira sp.]|nr:hypothetical protein [Nitrospira sp.]
MKKFEVYIRGKNFLISTDNGVRKNNFYAGRFIEADDMSDALDRAMGSIRAGLKDAVLNDKSDPPTMKVEDISEVYYFQDKILWQGMV